jgi:hypothetical protein
MAWMLPTSSRTEGCVCSAAAARCRGQGVIDTLDPVEQGKHLKYNHLIANAATIQNVIDLTRAVRELHADGCVVRRDDLAQLSPYQTRRLKRFGWIMTWLARHGRRSALDFMRTVASWGSAGTELANVRP